jgi:ligand-binding sensor domain-containing protein
MLCDRDGAVWLATGDHGVVHIHQGRTDVFGRSNGMSGDSATSLLEDHEGNIWVVAFGGLDRFREIAVAAVSVEQGLSHSIWGFRMAEIWCRIYRHSLSSTNMQLSMPRAHQQPSHKGSGAR